MKILKITLIAVISSVLMVLPSNAKEIRIGVAGAFTHVAADGTETLKSTSVKTNTEASENTILPSLFIELATDNGFGLGVEYVPSTADINSAARSTANDNVGSNDSGTNKAGAEIDGLTSIYLIKSFESGLFVKAGQTSTTVNTLETLSTGSKYGNVDIDGTVLGIGFGTTTDTGFFYRISGEYTDYDNISLLSQVADADTATKNKIDATVDTTAFKVAIGKAF